MGFAPLTPLAKFKDFLEKHKGKLELSHMELSVNWLSEYGEQFLTGSPKEREAVRKLMCEAYSIDDKVLREKLNSPVMSLEQKYVDDFMPLVPESGLFRRYIDYTKNTESPTPYHFFSFMTVLGATLGRQVFVDQNVYRIWPNMATLLIGPSGKVHKTTAADFAIAVAQRSAGAAIDIEVMRRFELIAEKTTSEALHSALVARGDPAVGMLYAPEVSTLLNKKEYNKGLIQDLTRLWDCPDYLPVRTQKREREVLKNVALSALFCSNEQWLADSVPEDAFKGGFFARMLQIYQPSTDRYFPRPLPLDKTLGEEIEYGVTETARVTGPATLTRRADIFFDKRYMELRKSIPDEEKIAPFFARYHDHMLRIAMLLAVAERPGLTSIYIEDEHVEHADKIMQWVTGWLPKVYAFLGVTDVGEDARRILFKILKAGGRITRTRLTETLIGRMTAGQLDERLRTLKQAHLIQELRGGLFEDEQEQVYYRLLKRPEDIL
jgi:hypothetical protein